MDADEYGGALPFGAAKPVIKAHGSSNARAIQNAIRQAVLCAESDLCGVMAETWRQRRRTKTETRRRAPQHAGRGGSGFYGGSPCISLRP